jgi:uncharacterized membrane-anchored protein
MKVLQIPLELCEMNLTVSEIGTLAILLSFSNLPWSVQKLWESDRNFQKTFDNLHRDGIISRGEDGSIMINLPSDSNNSYENKQTKHEEGPQMVAEQGSKKTHESVFCEDDSTT